MAENISSIRKRAWKTRREKYGQCGHNGSYSRAVYDLVLQEQRERFALCDAEPRLFIRLVRAIEDGPIDDPLFELSEGRATELLAERERRAVERAIANVEAMAIVLENSVITFGGVAQTGLGRKAANALRGHLAPTPRPTAAHDEGGVRHG